VIDNLLAPAVAFVVTVMAILLLRPLALRIGLTDKPDHRKQHEGEIPLVGGIAIFTGASVALFGSVLLTQGMASSPALFAWFTAGLLLLAVGVYDDLRSLSPALRFAAEIGAVFVMIYGGNTVLVDLGWITPNETLLQLDWMAAPFTIFAAVGIINAFNMCDGLDGLSGNLALVTLLAFGLVDGLWGSADRVALSNIMSAAVAGFLLFNQRMLWRSKANVFLGDAGSMMLGLTLLWGAIDISQGVDRALSPAATLWLLVVPIYDTVRVMLRRLVRGHSPFAADAFHLHHLIVRSGRRVSTAIAMICAAAATGAAIGIAGTYYGVSEFALATAFSCGGLAYYVLIERAWRRGSFLGRKLAPAN